MNERLGRLEARRKPGNPVGWVPDPERVIGTGAVLKSLDAYRRELDGLPPDPANELTEAELAFDRRATEAFLPYLEAERTRASPDTLEAIEQAIRMTKTKLDELDKEEAR